MTIGCTWPIAPVHLLLVTDIDESTDLGWFPWPLLNGFGQVRADSPSKPRTNAEETFPLADAARAHALMESVAVRFAVKPSSVMRVSHPAGRCPRGHAPQDAKTKLGRCPAKALWGLKPASRVRIPLSANSKLLARRDNQLHAQVRNSVRNLGLPTTTTYGRSRPRDSARTPRLALSHDARLSRCGRPHRSRAPPRR